MAKKIKSKSTASTSSWWSERQKILASIARSKPIRARPKIKKVKAKAKPKPKSIKAKTPVKAKKVTKMKKATKAKKTKTKRTK
jgi:hypothetical protein